MMNRRRPMSTSDLQPSERRFTTAMQQLGFGRFESVKILNGELVLDPWPVTVRNIRFREQEFPAAEVPLRDFALKQQVGRLYEQVRRIRTGEIRRLEIQNGLPFRMEMIAGAVKEPSR